MAFEKSWNTVPPTPLTADGTSLGVITISDTNGFKVKGLAQLSNTAGLKLVVQINQVLSPTVMIVGKPGSSPSATAGGLASGAVVDVSAFTVASGATIGFGMQPKNKIKPDDIEQATYECDPTVGVRVIPVDPYGSLIGPTNPLSVNLIPNSQIPFTLSSLTLPALITAYISTLTYTQVTSDTIGTEELLTFYDGASESGQIILYKTEDGWSLNLGGTEESFLLLETGSFFVLENNSGGILLE